METTKKNQAKTEFVVMTASEKMPSSCWGRYGKVAVVEIDPALLPDGKLFPAMISERARGVVRIVSTWGRLNRGTTARSAFWRACKEAEKLALELQGAPARIKCG